MALEVIDQPTLPREALHKCEEVTELFIAEVMGDEAAHNDVKGSARRHVEDIHDLEVDMVRTIGDVLRDPDRLRIKIHSEEREVKVSLARPASNCTKQIAVAATNIEDRQWRSVRRRLKNFAQPSQDRKMTKECRIEPRQIVQDLAELLWVHIVSVKPFLLMAALFEGNGLPSRFGHCVQSEGHRGAREGATELLAPWKRDTSEFQVSF